MTSLDSVEKVIIHKQLLYLREKALHELDQERTFTRDENPLKESLDFGDYGKATYDLDMGLLSQDAVRHVLRMIENALLKLEEGTYGTCDRCRKNIHPGRLEAIPYTPYCVECQALLEKDER